MNQRTQYLIQVLEKIGSPLMSSILQAPDRSTAADATQKDAQRMAELLARTTQASIEMSGAVDFGPARDQSDSLRVALAALASEMVGTNYKTNGKVPAENDLRRMTAAMQTVLTWSENFTPAADAATRLENLNASGQPVDPQQALLQYINAFVPVVGAVTTFPFGQPEQKLIMDITQRLVEKSAAMSAGLFGALGDTDKKRVELSLLTTLAKIYAACHSAETTRLMALPPDQVGSAGPGLDSVWGMFDIRVALVEALAQQMVPGGSSQSSSSGSRAPAPPPFQPQSQMQQSPAPPAFTPPPAAPAAPVAPPPAQPPAGANPLSMFAKKPDGEVSPPPAVPPAAPPIFSPPPAAQPPAQPPPSGNPMGFFKKDDSKKE